MKLLIAILSGVQAVLLRPESPELAVGDATIASLDQHERIEKEKHFEGSLLHYYAKVGLTRALNRIHEWTDLGVGCSSGASDQSSTSSCSSQNGMQSSDSQCFMLYKNTTNCVKNFKTGYCQCMGPPRSAYFLHPALF